MDYRKVYLLLVTACLLMVGRQAFSQQFPSQMWHKGYVITAKKDTVVGEVKYDMVANSVQVKTKTKAFSFSSHNLLLCEFLDVTIETKRRFYAMPYEVSKGFKARMLFELLFEGPTSLLSREEIVQETTPNNSIYGGTISRNRLKYYYYLLDNKGRIRYFNGKKPELLALLRDKAGPLKTFIKQNKLKTDEVRDLIRIIAFYNSI
ncbi:MAG: hypothetical protein AAFO69_04125 [Bacteroidota bacterium]